MVNFLNYLEDPAAPLLAPNIKCLKTSGLLLPEAKSKRYFYLTLHALYVVFVLTECIDILCVTSDLTLLLNNLKITMLACVDAMKNITYLKYQKTWKEIVAYLVRIDLEQRKSDDIENHKIITKITKYCRGVTYFYWSVIIVTASSVIMLPILKYMLSPSYRENTRNGDEKYLAVVDSWVPFDKTTFVGYIASCVFQVYGVVVAAFWLAAFDSSSAVFMMAFKAEIELLRRDSSKIFGSEDVPIKMDEIQKRLKNCQFRHQELIKYSKLFNSCLSPVLLLYFIVCSIMLCVTCYQITTEKSWLVRLMSAEYLSFGVAQLFMYCWHSNDVFYVSQDLRWGPYESLWWRCKEYRKDVMLLIIQFSRIFVFKAGPFADVSMYTFIRILKGAYSYYTLLSKSDQ